ncbi:MAG TPA: aminotransferase class I/II-fold pyridoxal phosphate-dependent enzyme [Thermomicrobiales bacterium]
MSVVCLSAERSKPFPSSGIGVDHREAPLLAALREYREREIVPFSTPGHKQGAAVDDEAMAVLGASTFAADVWLNAGDFDRCLRAAESLAADAWGAERGFFLSNGSSAGNHAALLATVNPGDVVIVNRDLHTSLLAGLILSGARPVYVMPRLHPELDASLGLEAAEVAAALRRHPEAKLIALVSPTYWGVASDVAAIAAVAHEHGVPLYVDEAWGPHFAFHPALPRPALASGADLAVTSVHKLLSGLGQGALLLARGSRVDPGRLAASVRMTRSTSPSVRIYASLDACRRQMALAGEALLERTLALATEARRRLGRIRGLTVLDADRLGVAATRCDPTRLAIDVHGLGLTGIEVERELWRRFGIAPEMSDLRGIVCLLTIGDTAASVDRLVRALATIGAEACVDVSNGSDRLPRSGGALLAPGAQVLTPREAFGAPTRAVPLGAAVGEIAAELIVPYPPGIPVLAPGEAIGAEKVAYLAECAARGLHVCGAADAGLETVRVVGWASGVRR